MLEATGRFTSAEAARGHLKAGASKVLVSAPSDGADVTLAYGVNNDAYDPAVHTIVSNASCTTNALAPLAAVLDELMRHRARLHDDGARLHPGAEPPGRSAP